MYFGERLASFANFHIRRLDRRRAVSSRYVPPWPSFKTLLRQVVVAAVAICCIGGAGDAYWDWISDMRADMRAYQEQTRQSEETIAWLSTPEGREEYNRQLDAEEEQLRRDSILSDPEHMAGLLPCVQWPSDLRGLCAQVGGDTEWSPPPPAPAKVETPTEKNCKRLTTVQMMACYDRYGE